MTHTINLLEITATNLDGFINTLHKIKENRLNKNDALIHLKSLNTFSKHILTGWDRLKNHYLITDRTKMDEGCNDLPKKIGSLAKLLTEQRPERLHASLFDMEMLASYLKHFIVTKPIEKLTMFRNSEEVVKQSVKKVKEQYPLLASRFQKIATDLFFGDLGQKLPEIKVAGIAQTPRYYDWLMGAAIILSEGPTELTDHADFIPPSAAEEKIALLKALWEGSETVEIKKVRHLQEAFWRPSFPREMFNALITVSSYDEITLQHYSNDANLTLDRIKKLTEPGLKSAAFQVYAEKMTSEKRFDLLLQLCREGEPQNSPPLQDYILKTVREADSLDISFQFLPYLVHFPHSAGKIGVIKESAASITAYLEQLSSSSLQERFEYELPLFGRFLADHDDVPSLVNLYLACADVNNTGGGEMAYKILEPYFARHQNNMGKLLELLETVAGTIEREPAQRVIVQMERLLKQTTLQSLDNIDWTSWMGFISASGNHAYRIFNLLRLYFVYIPLPAIDKAWNNTIDKVKSSEGPYPHIIYSSLHLLLLKAEKEKDPGLLYKQYELIRYLRGESELLDLDVYRYLDGKLGLGKISAAAGAIYRLIYRRG